MIKTKLVLYNGNRDACGRSSISIYISRPFRIYIGSGFFARPEDWDERTSLYTGRNAKAINSSLEQQLSGVIRKLTELREDGRVSTMSAKELRGELSGIEKVERKVTLGEMVTRVKSTKSRKSQAGFGSLIYNIRAYGEQYLEMPLSSITRSWLEGFSHFMLEGRGLKRNTVKEMLTLLAHVVNVALDDELIERSPFRRFSIKGEQTRSRALDVETLRRIGSTDCGRHNFERDVFMLSFMLLGINISDLLGAKLKDIKNGRLEYRRNKTGRLFSVKVTEEAWEIINRLKGEERLIGRAETQTQLVTCINKQLHKLGPKGAPIFPELTTYWARHTWATIAAELDIPTDVISEALGHQHTGAKVTGVYVRYSLAKVDAANRKVLDYVLGKKEGPSSTDGPHPINQNTNNDTMAKNDLEPDLAEGVADADKDSRRKLTIVYRSDTDAQVQP